MTKNHLKTISVPRRWPIQRKKNTFVARPRPGAHSLQLGTSLRTVCIDLLKIAKTKKEVNYIIHEHGILVDNKPVKDARAIVGLFDTLTFPKSNEYFRIVITKRGILSIIPISKEESEKKVCRITGKSSFKGKIQYHLYSGRNIISDKSSYAVGDTLLIRVPSQEIIEHIPFEKGIKAYLIGGSHEGTIGVINKIEGNDVILENSSKESLHTRKQYAVPVGDHIQE